LMSNFPYKSSTILRYGFEATFSYCRFHLVNK
jgi:hypothetical protein